LILHAKAPPAKMVYNVYLRAGGREVKVANWIIKPMPGGEGYTLFTPDIDPAGKATSCDVILRPDPDWEVHTPDLTPPWGGEVVFPNVKIESSH